MVELLKQGQFKPYDVIDQVISIFAGAKGFLDDLPIDKVEDFEEKMLAYFRDEIPEVRNELATQKALTDELVPKMESGIKTFKDRYTN